MTTDDLLTIVRDSGKHVLGVHPSVMAAVAGTPQSVPPGYRIAVTLAGTSEHRHVVLEAWPALRPTRAVALDDRERTHV